MNALEKIKAATAQEALLLLVNDEDAKRLAVGWTYYHPHFKDFAVSEKADVNEVVEEAWERVEMDLQELADASGLSAMVVERKLPMLATARIIYPDGTISELAAKVLRAEVASIVKKLVEE